MKKPSKNPWEPSPKRKAQIERLAKASATSPEWVFDMVLSFGLEMAEDELEPQINLVASVKAGPEKEKEDEVSIPSSAALQEPLPREESNGTSQIEDAIDLGQILDKKRADLEAAPVPINGSKPQEGGTNGNGSHDAKERRDEQPEGGTNDFVDSLVTGQGRGNEGGGIENEVQ